MKTLDYFNFALTALFLICYSYQFYYIYISFISLKKRSKNTTVAPLRKYAVLISARNEESVIDGLIASIREQSYPAELVDIFVVADNCTDATAQIARDAGATRVWERQNTAYVGKGYALRFLLERIETHFGWEQYDGYFVFDADNLLDRDYILEMNRVFSDEHRIVTSYRNSKNYGDNWISAGYSLWFLRESRFLNDARMTLGTSCAVSGTGFLMHRDVICRNDGWKYFLLTEDIEFSIDSILHGERICYCPQAHLYDEQPTSFRQSWRQRLRWAKGYLQVFRDYGDGLLKGAFCKKMFACYDMAMAIMPAAVITIAGAAVNGGFMVADFVTRGFADIGIALASLGMALLNMYLTLFVIGAITTYSEWKNIYTTTAKKLLYTFTFPLFMMTYMPISLAAFFSKAEWKPIKHSVRRSINEIKAA